MKELVIIYNQPLSARQGINMVNNSFIEGRAYFNDNNITLKAIIGADDVINCTNCKSLYENFPLDSSISSLQKRIKTFVKRFVTRKNRYVDAIKIYYRYYHTAKIAIKRFAKSGMDPDYIIFQDPQTAQLYYQKFGHTRKAHTLLILHCSISPTEQAETSLPNFFKSSFLSRYFYNTYHEAMNNVDKIIYLSQRAVNNSPVSQDKKTFIFNGMEDLECWEVSEVHNPINLVCVGSMSWHKGQDYTIEALAKLPKEILHSVKLHLIGSGPQIQELKNRVKQLNLSDNVVFYGVRNDVPELLKSMDLFIMPSQSEGLPMSIIEALRQGMYIIATDTGAIPEMIPSGCGELIERNSDMIAESIVRVVCDNKISIETKVKARNHYLDNFTLKSMIYNYCKVLGSL